QPEKGVGEKEVAHLVASKVGNDGAPLRVLALAGVGVLVEMRAVEEAQALLVAREVRRNPVEQHADIVLVAVIDEIHEVLRRAVASGGGIVASDLIAPGAVEGMLADGHELNVGIAQLLHIWHELVRQVAVGDRPAARRRGGTPGAGVYLVDADRRVEAITPGPLLQPAVITPAIAA